MRYEELTIEGRNAVLEAFRAGKPIDRLFILDGCQDGPVKSFCGKQKNTIPSSPLCPKSGWTRCLTRATTRGSSLMEQPMNMQRWRIC